MGLDATKFMQLQGKMRKIMEMDANGQLDKYSKNVDMDASGNFLINETSNYSEPFTENTYIQQDVYNTPQMESVNVKNSRLPKEILESMESNPIDTKILEAQMGQASVLDALGVPKNFENSRRLMGTKHPKPAQQLTETVQIQSAIDYSLIKTIVEDCVKKSIASLKKTMLTESTNNNSGNEAVLIKLGEGFKFVTKSGDIYAATGLKKVGHIDSK